MRDYLKISLILSTFGFLKETRPSESYITQFIVDFKNVTLEQVNQDIFPIGTYSYLAQLGIIFLVTDFLRYKPLIILNSIAGIVIWSMLLFLNSIWSLQVVESVYGTYQACEIAYYAYIYARTDKEHYQVVTSHTRAAIFVGRFISAVSSQILVYWDVMDYRQLNYLTLIAQVCCSIWAISMIPRVNNSIYFNQSIDKAFRLIWKHLRTSYLNRFVVIWSLYYAIAVCFFNQAVAYIQVLWITVNESQEVQYNVYNGTVDAILTLLSIISYIIAGKVHINFLKNQNRALISLILMSVLQGVFLLLAALSQTLIMCYIFYILYGIAYAFGITICATEIASNLPEDTYGLVFGFNTLIGTAIQTIVTLTFVSDGFLLSPRGQYQTYSFFFFALALIFLMIFISRLVKR